MIATSPYFAMRQVTTGVFNTPRLRNIRLERSTSLSVHGPERGHNGELPAGPSYQLSQKLSVLTRWCSLSNQYVIRARQRVSLQGIYWIGRHRVSGPERWRLNGRPPIFPSDAPLQILTCCS